VASAPGDSHPHDLAELARMSPRPDIRLIAADMDGTLVDDGRQIHDEFWPLIDTLHARGITFCPASGRQYYNLRPSALSKTGSSCASIRRRIQGILR